MGLPQALAQGYPRGNAPLERMLPEIRRQYPGTFYDAEGPFADPYGNPHYHIKWLTPDGRVIWLDTDARTGHVVGVNGSGWRAQQYRGPGYNGPGYNGAPSYGPPPGWGGNPRGWNGGGPYRGGPPGNGGNFHGGNPQWGNGRWNNGGHHGH